MSETTLPPLLADGEFHSADALAAALGVGRATVLKQLKDLAELGLELESVGGRGYRIPGGLELLDADRIRAGLSPRAVRLLQRLELRETVGSTNTEVMLGLERGWGPGSVCTAEQQTAGRGRRGRRWVSPYARNLYVSLAWAYDRGAAALNGLSLAVGVGVARALAACGLPPVQLKWPNDILSGGAKLGGILLETAGDADSACQVVVGVGLNVAMPVSSGGAIDQRWTDISTLAGGACPGRNVLLAALLNELLPLLEAFEVEGFGPWRAAWQDLDACAGAEVTLETGGRAVVGIARGVDGRGALQLETAAGIESVFGGEITLRNSA